MKSLLYNIKLTYYRLFEPYDINHYNVINKLNLYKSLELYYYHTYPNAKSFMNMNETLFLNNPTAESDFKMTMEKQKKLKKSILDDMKYLCEKSEFYTINNKKFKTFYIEQNYHVEQNIDALINELKKDIETNDM